MGKCMWCYKPTDHTVGRLCWYVCDKCTKKHKGTKYEIAVWLGDEE